MLEEIFTLEVVGVLPIFIVYFFFILNVLVAGVQLNHLATVLGNWYD